MNTFSNLSPLLCIQILLGIGGGMCLLGIFRGATSGATEHLSTLSSGTGVTSKEKRREVRTKCNVLLEIMDSSQQISGIGRMLDKSRGGALISTGRLMREGDPILAKVSGLSQGTKFIAGRIIWTRYAAGDILYGVQFRSSSTIN